MKKVLIIANHKAGNAKISWLKQEFKRNLWGWDFEWHAPKSIDDASEIINGADQSIVEAVVIVGGDGTLNRLLPTIIKKPNLKIGLFPAGTANDLASAHQLKDSCFDLQMMIDKEQLVKVDLIKVNESYFSTTGGIGIGALTTAKINDTRKKSQLICSMLRLVGSHSYSLIAAQLIALGWHYNNRVKIEADEGAFEGNTASVLVCNQRYLGRGLLIAPNACDGDGLFDVVALKSSGRVNILQNLVNAKYGEGLAPDFLLTTKRCRISSLDQKQLIFFGDGETLLKDEVFDISLCPGALSLYSPKLKVAQ